MAAVTLNKVKKVYPNGYEAIHGLDLHIEDQEFLVVVGPSGCGKSTALRMIAGLEEISGGELSIGENIVTDEAPKDRDIAMVFQNYALYPHKTVRENIGFALKLAKVPSAERTQRVNEAAQILELTDLLDRKPAQLSGGQRQRVAMGRAIVRRPAAFLMDEPLSNLDAKLRVQMRAEISALQRELRVTTVYVTHDQTEAMTMGDRVAVLKDGHLQQVGTPAELYDNPANVFVAGFIGSPSMNLFEATLEERTLRLGSVALELPQSLFDASPELVERRGQDLIVGIRPEDLEDPRYAPADRYQGKIPAVVSLTELLGSEVIAHLDVEATRVDSGDPDAVETLGASPAVGRFDSRTAVTAGDSLEVAVAIDRFHFFDAKTRNAIAGPR